MDPDQIARRDRYLKIAQSLQSASHFYQKAVDTIDHDGQDPAYYHFVQEANQLVDSCFPEKFQVNKLPPIGENVRKGFEWAGFLKILIPLVLILGVLLFMVFSGTTGDMTSSWNARDVIKNSQYPKQPEIINPSVTPPSK
jgi:hypothetical protein